MGNIKSKNKKTFNLMIFMITLAQTSVKCTFYIWKIANCRRKYRNLRNKFKKSKMNKILI